MSGSESPSANDASERPASSHIVSPYLELIAPGRLSGLIIVPLGVWLEMRLLRAELWRPLDARVFAQIGVFVGLLGMLPWLTAIVGRRRQMVGARSSALTSPLWTMVLLSCATVSAGYTAACSAEAQNAALRSRDEVLSDAETLGAVATLEGRTWVSLPNGPRGYNSIGTAADLRSICAAQSRNAAAFNASALRYAYPEERDTLAATLTRLARSCSAGSTMHAEAFEDVAAIQSVWFALIEVANAQGLRPEWKVASRESAVVSSGLQLAMLGTVFALLLETTSTVVPAVVALGALALWFVLEMLAPANPALREDLYVKIGDRAALAAPIAALFLAIGVAIRGRRAIGTDYAIAVVLVSPCFACLVWRTRWELVDVSRLDHPWRSWHGLPMPLADDSRPFIAAAGFLLMCSLIGWALARYRRLPRNV